MHTLPTAAQGPGQDLLSLCFDDMKVVTGPADSRESLSPGTGHGKPSLPPVLPLMRITFPELQLQVWVV